MAQVRHLLSTIFPHLKESRAGRYAPTPIHQQVHEFPRIGHRYAALAAMVMALHTDWILVRSFLHRFVMKSSEEFDIIDNSIVMPKGIILEAGFMRTWPHIDGMDGFFAAALRKR